MASLKALTNQYNNLRSQRVQIEHRVEDAKNKEQEAADALATEEARRKGIVVGGEVLAPYYSKKLPMVVLGFKGHGPGKYKVRVAIPKKDGGPSTRVLHYRCEDVEAIAKEAGHA